MRNGRRWWTRWSSRGLITDEALRPLSRAPAPLHQRVLSALLGRLHAHLSLAVEAPEGHGMSPLGLIFWGVLLLTHSVAVAFGYFLGRCFPLRARWSDG